MTNLAYNPAREDLYHIAGDMDHGVTTGINLGANKIEIPIRYKDVVLFVDLYPSPDGSKMIHLICPRCMHDLRIESKNKQIDWDPEKGLSVEPFGCTWELGRSDATMADRIMFGAGLCNWTVGISDSKARDA